MPATCASRLPCSATVAAIRALTVVDLTVGVADLGDDVTGQLLAGGASPGAVTRSRGVRNVWLTAIQEHAEGAGVG